jgi:hypothetical protein
MGRQKGNVAKGFSAVRMRNMNLNNRTCNSGECIAQCDRCMGIAASINQNSIARKTIPLQSVNKLTFVIALKIIDLMRRKVCT